MNNWERLNKLDHPPKNDLHYGITTTLDQKAYHEFSFHCDFDELMRISCELESDLTGNEILELIEFLNISFDKLLVGKVYANPLDQSVEVFHSESDEQIFVYFDLQKDPTDQHDTFFLGISCHKDQASDVQAQLLDIYKKLDMKSEFVYQDKVNDLYNKVFNSSLYFYQRDQEIYKREMHHHNLIGR